MSQSQAFEGLNQNQKKVRRNGFSMINGLNFFQIISWSYGLLDIGIAYFQISKFQSVELQVHLFFCLQNHQIVLFIWLTLITLAMFNTCIWATYIDPTDPTIYQEHLAINKTYQLQQFNQLEGFLLQTLKRTVQFVKAMSSREQNTVVVAIGNYTSQIFKSCTSLFDHHCIWLNNCIGELNYRYFFFLVILLNVFKATKLSFDIAHLINKFDAIIEIFSIISIIFDPFLLLIFIYLLVLHCYFKQKKITTYDWIRRKRDDQKQLRASRLPLKKDSLTEKKLEDQSHKLTPSESAQYGILLSSSKRFDLASVNQMSKFNNEPKFSTIQQWISDEACDKKQSIDMTIQRDQHNITPENQMRQDKFQNNRYQIQQAVINENEEIYENSSSSRRDRKKDKIGFQYKISPETLQVEKSQTIQNPIQQVEINQNEDIYEENSNSSRINRIKEKVVINQDQSSNIPEIPLRSERFQADQSQLQRVVIDEAEENCEIKSSSDSHRDIIMEKMEKIKQRQNNEQEESQEKNESSIECVDSVRSKSVHAQIPPHLSELCFELRQVAQQEHDIKLDICKLGNEYFFLEVPVTVQILSISTIKQEKSQKQKVQPQVIREILYQLNKQRDTIERDNFSDGTFYSNISLKDN